ncbi:MAG TPA: hypothetical protein VI488_08235 [Candidatus Angelobacter sp.]
MNRLFARSLSLFVISLLLGGSVCAQRTPTVLTWHNDIFRTGQNLRETVLTPATVNPASFGKLFSYPVDGMLYAQPLYVPHLAIPGKGIHNVVYLATQKDSVYAFDADNAKANPSPLWFANFTDPPRVTPVPCRDNQVDCNVYPIIGITGTPVISLSNHSIYLVARTKETDQQGHASYFSRLHALDIATGAEKSGSPVVICGRPSGETCAFDYGTKQSSFNPQHEMARPGLLLMPSRATGHDVVYIGFAGESGWLLAYDAQTLALLAAFPTGPNIPAKNRGRAGIWGSGGALAGDTEGNIYAATGDGIFDVNKGGSDYGDTLLKLNLVRQSFGAFEFQVSDYFTPSNYICLNAEDLDLSSSGPLVLPKQKGSHVDEILIAGKSNPGCNRKGSPIRVIDRNNLGHVNGQVQEVNGSPGGYFSSPAYWQDSKTKYVYYAGADPGAFDEDGDEEKALGDHLRLYRFKDGVFNPTSSVSESPNLFHNGGTPAISADRTERGIVWIIERRDPLSEKPGNRPAYLHAFDATDVSRELYSSETRPARDAAGPAVKFVVLTIVNGKVYVGTQTELDVYGLCPCPQ